MFRLEAVGEMFCAERRRGGDFGGSIVSRRTSDRSKLRQPDNRWALTPKDQAEKSPSATETIYLVAGRGGSRGRRG